MKKTVKEFEETLKFDLKKTQKIIDCFFEKYNGKELFLKPQKFLELLKQITMDRYKILDFERFGDDNDKEHVYIYLTTYIFDGDYDDDGNFTNFIDEIYELNLWVSENGWKICWSDFLTKQKLLETLLKQKLLVFRR